ncbi:hypothetical protein BDR03DRAFT_986715 [Suillus americanus]|nr:hypothetical protein BDR03DRAFT_986715 [Suillus americanus]
MTLNYSTPARIMLIVPCTGDGKHISNSDSGDNEKRRAHPDTVVLSNTLRDNLRAIVNHLTTRWIIARAWKQFDRVSIGSTYKPCSPELATQCMFGESPLDAMATPAIAAAVMIIVYRFGERRAIPGARMTFQVANNQSTSNPLYEGQHLMGPIPTVEPIDAIVSSLACFDLHESHDAQQTGQCQDLQVVQPLKLQVDLNGLVRGKFEFKGEAYVAYVRNDQFTIPTRTPRQKSLPDRLFIFSDPPTSILHQLNAAGRKKCLHNVDQGVIDNLLPLMRHHQNSWVGHGLGVDPPGLQSRPRLSRPRENFEQMSILLRDVVAAMDDDTLLIMFGNHGMDKMGNDGGDSVLETMSAPWIYSRVSLPPLFPIPEAILPMITLPDAMIPHLHIQQIDLVSTISLLLGLPIPFNNVGTVIPENLNLVRLIVLDNFTHLALSACCVLWAHFNIFLMRAGSAVIGLSIVAGWALYSQLRDVADDEWENFTALTSRLRYRIPGFSTLFAICAHLMAMSTVCQGGTTRMLYRHLLRVRASSAPPLTALLVFPVAIVVPHVVRRILKISKSDSGLTATFITLLFVPSLIAGTMFWMLEWVDSAEVGDIGDTLRVTRAVLARTAAAVMLMWVFFGLMDAACLSCDFTKPIE